MKKGLIYYCVGGDPDYFQLTMESLKSLRASTWSFDVLVLCDVRYREALRASDTLPCEDANGRPVLFCVTPDNPDVVAASMRKIEIFSLLGDTPHTYDAALYLDSDILATQPLDAAFDAVAHNRYVLHTAPEHAPEPHLPHYFTNTPRLPIQSPTAAPFNAGTFGFVPSRQMKAHFDAIVEDVRAWEGPYFWEQSFMNDHFLRRHPEAAKPTFAAPRVHIPNHGGLLAAFDPHDTWFVHFANAQIPWRTKLAGMKAWCSEQ